MKEARADHPWLSVGAQRLIWRVRDSKTGELDCFCPGGWWIETHRVSGRYCMELLRLCLLRKMNIGNEPNHDIFNLSPDAVGVLEKGETPLYIKALKERKS